MACCVLIALLIASVRRRLTQRRSGPKPHDSPGQPSTERVTPLR